MGQRSREDVAAVRTWQRSNVIATAVIVGVFMAAMAGTTLAGIYSSAFIWWDAAIVVTALAVDVAATRWVQRVERRR